MRNDSEDSKPVIDPGPRRTRIGVELYAGGYGPTIRISASEPDDLLRLLDLFSRLGSGLLGECELCEWLGVRPSGLARVDMAVAGREFGKSLSSTRAGNFVWSRSPSGWEWCADQIEGLVEHDEPAHQYLTAEGVDDALVEVSYREQ